MRYYRCQCGRRTSWSSMGVEPCQGCEDCHTTLAEGPDDHTTPAPHEWTEEWVAGPASAPPKKQRLCLRCLIHEPIPSTPAPRAMTTHRCSNCQQIITGHFLSSGGVVWHPYNCLNVAPTPPSSYDDSPSVLGGAIGLAMDLATPVYESPTPEPTYEAPAPEPTQDFGGGGGFDGGGGGSEF